MPKYHMHKHEREITNENELIEVLQNGKFTTIAMCRDNEPYIVTLSYGYDKNNNALYFHAALKGLKLEFIKHNPSVCGTVIEDLGYVEDECEQHFRSVVFRGKISIIGNLDDKKHGLDILLDHLEKNPDPIKIRNIKNDDSYNKITMLKFEITEITGKTTKKK